MTDPGTALSELAGAVGADDGSPADPAATVAAAVETRPDALAGALSSAVEALADGDAGARERGAATLLAAFDAAGAELLRELPGSAWAALVACVDAADGDGPAGTYAAAAVRAAAGPEEGMRSSLATLVADRRRDPDDRRVAMALYRRTGVPDDDAVAGVVGALGAHDADPPTRRAAALALDYRVGDGDAPLADEPQVETVRRACGDEDLRVRAAAASVLLRQATLGGGEPGAWVGDALETVAALLRADDRRARLRTAGVLDAHAEMLTEETLPDCPPATVAAFALALSDVARTGEPADVFEVLAGAGGHYRPPWVRPSAVRTDLPAFVERGWGEPGCSVARKAVADAVADDPGAVPVAVVERLVAAAGEHDDGHAATALAALAPNHPELVAEAAPVLVAALDDPDPPAGTVRAVAALARAAPDAVPLTDEALVDGVTPVVVEGPSGTDELRGDRLLALATVDPDRAVDALAAVARDPAGLSTYTFEQAVARFAREDRETFAAAAEHVAAVVAGMGPRAGREEALPALAALAAERPDAVAPAAPHLAAAMVSYDEGVRTAAARALSAVAAERPDAIPAWARPAVDREDSEDPLTALARAPRSEFTERLLDALTAHPDDSVQSPRDVADTLAAVRAGDEGLVADVAVALLERLVERDDDPAYHLRRAVEDVPDLAGHLAPAVVEERARADRARSSLDHLLGAVAREAPEAVEGALAATFEAPTDLLALDGGSERHRQQALRAALGGTLPDEVRDDRTGASDPAAGGTGADETRAVGPSTDPDDRSAVARWGVYEDDLYDSLQKLADAVPAADPDLPPRAEADHGDLFAALARVDRHVDRSDLAELTTIARAEYVVLCELGHEGYAAATEGEVHGLVDDAIEEERGRGRTSLSEAFGRALGKFLPGSTAEELREDLEED